MEEDTLKNELSQFMSKKKQAEQQSEEERLYLKMKASQARVQLDQAKTL